MKTSIIILVFASLVVGCPIASAQTSIAAAKAAGGTVSFRGIVTNGPELGNIRYVQDTSGGISVYHATLVNNLNRGDSILAGGSLALYHCLEEVTPTIAPTVLTPAKPLPAPKVLTSAKAINQRLQGVLVRFNNCTFITSGIFTAASSYMATLPSGDTITVYFGSTTSNSLLGVVSPTSTTVHLIGIMSQFASTPCSNGYQLLLRDTSDIIYPFSIWLTTVPLATNITKTSFDLGWSTNIAGTKSYVKYGMTPLLEIGTIASNNAVNHTVTLPGLTAGTIYYARTYSINNLDTTKSTLRVFATQSLSSGTIKTYYNRVPDLSVSSSPSNNAIRLNNAVGDTMAAYIGRAKQSIDIAIYNWDYNPEGKLIASAVSAAAVRGVKIRVIYDGSSTNGAIPALNAAIHSLKSPQGSTYTIMHNKFVIIDANSADPNAPIVWTGSTNWTAQQMQTDANNVIIFQDQSLARGYKLEFDEMWGDSSQTSAANTTVSRFGEFKSDNTPHEYVIGGSRVESYFSPSDQVNSMITNTITTASTELYFCLLQFTPASLANAIKFQIGFSSMAAGKLRGMVDDSTTSPIPWGLLRNPLVLGNDMAAYEHGVNQLLHSKYMIVDQSNLASDPLVLTGSHNWTTAANTQNDENTVIVHNANIANQYFQDFNGRWSERYVTGINELSKNKLNLNAFPNPNNGSFTLTYSIEKNEKVIIKLFDITGREVYSLTQTGVMGNNQINIQTDKLSKGLYMLQLTAGQSSSQQKIMVE